MCSDFPRIAAFFLLLSSLTAFAAAQSGNGNPPGAAAPQPSRSMPDWARTAGEPLWSFAWISDLHLDESRRELAVKAFRCLDQQWKPAFVLFTGDNNAIAAAPAAEASEPIGVRRQRFFKSFVKEHLNAPAVVIPGDNWPEGFDRVFGARQYSFDYGGLHFLLLAPDRTFHGQGAEGLSVFDGPTWNWIRDDLEQSRQEPTLVAIHEPFVPCTFLDAPQLRTLVERYPNVIAAFQGHLHVDLEFRSGGQTYLVAPALGRTAPPGMKVIQVHPTVLVLRTIQYDKPAGRFAVTDRWQKIPIPKPQQDKPARPSEPGFAMQSYRCVPPHPHLNDPALAGRKDELWKAVRETLGADVFRWH